MLTTSDIDDFVARFDNIKANYCGTYAVYELDSFDKCIGLSDKFNGKRLPSCIFNTDPIKLPGIHWMTLLKLQNKRSFVLFDSFGALGFQEFLMGNDEITLRLPKIQTVAAKKGFYFNGAKTFNKLPYYIRKADSIKEFKELLNSYFN